MACGITLRVLKERREGALINPKIYPAFKRIELRAFLYVEQNAVNREEYERCKAVVDRWEQMMKHPDSDMSAEEYYKFLTGLGFQLPPFKLKKPATQEEWNRCKLESDR